VCTVRQWLGIYSNAVMQLFGSEFVLSGICLSKNAGICMHMRTSAHKRKFMQMRTSAHKRNLPTHAHVRTQNAICALVFVCLRMQARKCVYARMRYLCVCVCTFAHKHKLARSLTRLVKVCICV
jgi:hypothetical protein